MFYTIEARRTDIRPLGIHHGWEDGMEVWVQGRLFDGEPGSRQPSGNAPASGRAAARPRARRAGWAPVTRDPAVATSHAESARMASDIRIGLARAYDRLTPELRQAIRTALGSERERTAA
jgi:hypothetical protein